MGMPESNNEFSEEVDIQIDVNELLQVRIEGDDTSVTYYSRVSDIAQGKLIIAWPTHAGMRLLAHKDQILAFNFVRDYVPHEFSGMVDEMHSEGLPQLTIIQSSAIARIQRRQNFRVKCMIPVEITGTQRDARTDTDIPFNLRTTTSDVSAGGVGIRCAKPIPENTLLEIKLSLPDDAPLIRIPCRVVFSDSPAENQMMYRAGVRFLAISESERARIVRYVYRTQLKGLRN